MDAKSKFELVSSLYAAYHNSAVAYLATLKASSHRPQKHAPDTIAKVLTSGGADCFHIDWSRLRYQHTAAVRTWLMDHYKPANPAFTLIGLIQ